MLTQTAKEHGIHPSQTKPDGFEVLVDADLDELSMNELRKLAKANNITVPRGTNKPELLIILKGE